MAELPPPLPLPPEEPPLQPESPESAAAGQQPPTVEPLRPDYLVANPVPAAPQVPSERPPLAARRPLDVPGDQPVRPRSPGDFEARLRTVARDMARRLRDVPPPGHMHAEIVDEGPDEASDDTGAEIVDEPDEAMEPEAANGDNNEGSEQLSLEQLAALRSDELAPTVESRENFRDALDNLRTIADRTTTRHATLNIGLADGDYLKIHCAETTTAAAGQPEVTQAPQLAITTLRGDHHAAFSPGGDYDVIDVVDLSNTVDSFCASTENRGFAGWVRGAYDALEFPQDVFVGFRVSNLLDTFPVGANRHDQHTLFDSFPNGTVIEAQLNSGTPIREDVYQPHTTIRVTTEDGTTYDYRRSRMAEEMQVSRIGDLQVPELHNGQPQLFVGPDGKPQALAAEDILQQQEAAARLAARNRGELTVKEGRLRELTAVIKAAFDSQPKPN